MVEETYKHKPMYLMAIEEEFLMRSLIFGKKLVSMPFTVPYDGVCVDDRSIGKALIEEMTGFTSEEG